MTNAADRNIDTLGPLTSIIGATEFPSGTPEASHRYDELLLLFSRGKILVRALPADDTIQIENNDTALSVRTDLTYTRPWHQLIGCTALWSWHLRNHRGYADGFQIEFGQPGKCLTIQLMCEGGSLSVRSVNSLDLLRNQLRGPGEQTNGPYNS